MPIINATIAHQLGNPPPPGQSLRAMKYPEDFNTWIISVSDPALAGHTINVTNPNYSSVIITSFVLNGSGVGSVTVHNVLNGGTSSYLSYNGTYAIFDAVWKPATPYSGYDNYGLRIESASDGSYNATFGVPCDPPYGSVDIANLHPSVGDSVLFKSGYHLSNLSYSGGEVVAEDLSTYVNVVLTSTGGTPDVANLSTGTTVYYGPGSAGSHLITYLIAIGGYSTTPQLTTPVLTSHFSYGVLPTVWVNGGFEGRAVIESILVTDSKICPATRELAQLPGGWLYGDRWDTL